MRIAPFGVARRPLLSAILTAGCNLPLYSHGEWGKSMTTIVRTEKRRRGIFGILVWWTFLTFNALMASSLFYAIMFTSEKVGEGLHAEMQAGKAIGETITASALLWVWVIGSVILGLVVALTRRTRGARLQKTD
jgi:beta-lactamase regulating signal transducer with metallopeptidase domain